MYTFSKKLKKLFFKYILRRKYYRHGKCNQCGACCQKIYVRHKKSVVKTEEELEQLRKIHPFYRYIEVVDKDDFGLVFKCSKLDIETKSCSIHRDRPGICRRYPSEQIFSMSAELSDGCGFGFSPIESFEEVFSRTQKKSKKNF